MIPLIKPTIPFDAVAGDLRGVLESGRLTMGPYVAEFERLVADYVGVRHAFATTSATTALHLALVVAGIGPGDEVLVSDFTFPASGNAIVQTGAVPVLVDCRPGRFDLDPDDAAAKITPRTRAIMPVDPFGQPADMVAVCDLARRHGLVVVEDAACAIGARIARRMCGAWDGMGCFSFHPRKLITTGEGGMVTTNDDAIAEKIRVLRAHGGVIDTVGLRFVENGFNYRLSEIQAVLGIEQMRRVDAILTDRRATAGRMIAGLSAVDGVSIPLSAGLDEVSVQSLVVLLADDINRDSVIRNLREAGIESTLGTYAMHAHPAFARFGYAPGDLPNAWRAQRQSLTLPVLAGMDQATIDRVTGAVAAAIATGTLSVAGT